MLKLNWSQIAEYIKISAWTSTKFILFIFINDKVTKFNICVTKHGSRNNWNAIGFYFIGNDITKDNISCDKYRNKE